MNLCRALLPFALLVLFVETSSANDEVVKRLQSLAEAAPGVVDKSPPFIAPPNEAIPGWWRRQVYIRELSFDVRRTDSLVSPFSGEIAFNCHVRVARAKSEDELRSTPYTVDNLFGRCKVNYAYQGQKWIRKSGYCSWSGDPGAPPRLMDSPDKGELVTTA